MKAMILAAGLGTRLRPLTDDRPKALVQVAGRTMLEIVLARLRVFGVHEAIVNAHHHAEMIVEYLKAHDNFGMTIEVSREEAAGHRRRLEEGRSLFGRLAGTFHPAQCRRNQLDRSWADGGVPQGTGCSGNIGGSRPHDFALSIIRWVWAVMRPASRTRWADRAGADN